MKRILAVDDDAHILKLVAFSLKSGGYEVLEATDGLSAMSIALAEHPDLVLMDVMMPGLDGYKACRQLKADPTTADIPVIMLTAKTQATELKTGQEVGAVGYITKPFAPRDLVAQVREFLGE